jgi:hypothetical protein
LRLRRNCFAASLKSAPTTNKGEKPMQHEFQQYRFARIEGHNITRTRLEAQFKDGIADLDDLEKAIAQELAREPEHCAPWRKSEMEQMGCREGMQLAALEFYWEHRQELRRAIVDYSAENENCSSGR